MIKLSITSKLDGIKSWSLPAVNTCPGARDAKNQMVPVCQGCYARSGNYRFKNVQRVREHNAQDWKRTDWVDGMVWALENERYFRWFDSGDIPQPELAWKICLVIIRTPWCLHWLPTRSYKIPKIRTALEQIALLPNSKVRYSADELDDFRTHFGSVVVSDPQQVPDTHVLCRAYERQPASCNGCRACWTSEKPITYPAHGALKRKANAA